MAQKIVELASKRKVELQEMSVDDVDKCNDMTVLRSDEDGEPYVVGLSRARTAWLRKGIAGGDFKPFKIENDEVIDKVLRQLSEEEKNELLPLIQGHQQLGE